MYEFMKALARWLAILGGLVLSVLILMTCASIIGRELNAFLNGDMMQASMPGLANWILALGIGPVNGDFELVEAGVAFAIFCFLPLCQITAGHASVDIFTSSLPVGVNRLLTMLSEILFAAVLVLIAWRVGDGTLSKFNNGETTFLLQFPVWWAYALSLIGALCAAIVGVYMAYLRIVEFVTGQTIVAEGAGAEH